MDIMKPMFVTSKKLLGIKKTATVPALPKQEKGYRGSWQEYYRIIFVSQGEIMDKSIFLNLEKSISPERLAAYKADGVSNEVALARYEEFLSDLSAVFGNYYTIVEQFAGDVSSFRTGMN